MLLKDFGKDFMLGPAKSVLDNLEVRHYEREFVTQLQHGSSPESPVCL